VLLKKYYSGDQITKNAMGRAHSMYGRKEGCIEGVGEGSFGIETTWNT
jgi:hypothetical protein